jgi:hypothetical protein
MTNARGLLNVEAFKSNHPTVGTMLDDFVTMTCTILHHDPVLQTWPNTEALNALSKLAIDTILKAHRDDIDYEVADECKYLDFAISRN